MEELWKQKMELRWESRQEPTPKSFSKFTLLYERATVKAITMRVYAALLPWEHEILRNRFACLFLSSGRNEEYCQVLQTAELTHY